MLEFHKPVLIEEIITLLDPVEGGVYVDATLGGGGHSSELLRRIGAEGVLIGIDRDKEAIEYARERLSRLEGRLILVQGNFRDLASILESAGVREIDGAIFDFGVSSHQLDAERGFSFMRDEELDMRMSRQEDTPTAADIVNRFSERDLAAVIADYGEERYARRVARAIVARREKAPITTTAELADIVTHAIPAKHRWGDIHPATRTFQAIRMMVNSELEAIERGVPAAIEALKVGGRVCCVSFHSHEDRLVKRLFRRYSGLCECPPRLPACQCGAREILQVLTRKPVVPSEEEVTENPRSRSAKLRCAKRISQESVSEAA